VSVICPKPGRGAINLPKRIKLQENIKLTSGIKMEEKRIYDSKVLGDNVVAVKLLTDIKSLPLPVR
jgi:hypothetical protein